MKKNVRLCTKIGSNVQFRFVTDENGFGTGWKVKWIQRPENECKQFCTI